MRDRRVHPDQRTHKQRAGLTWGLAGVLIVLTITGIAFFWSAVGEWLSPKPTFSNTPTPLTQPTSTRLPFDATRIAATNTLSPDLTETTPTPAPTLSLLFPQGLPYYVNPLTGMGVADINLLERRPIAVKVSTFPRHVADWQSGLSMADQVFEYYIEDGLTRFIAIYYGNDADRVGPVRSGRYFDEHIMRMYHSLLVYSGADFRVDDYLFAYDDLKNYLILPNEYDCPPLCKDDQINDYNNYFIDTSKMSAYLAWRGIDNERQPLSGMAYSVLPPFTTSSAGRIFTRYSDYDYNYWQYDAITQKYLRFRDANDTLNGAVPNYNPQIDHLNDQQISTDNLVELFVRHIHNPQSSGEMFVFDLFNSGQAFIFRDGKVYQATWTRTARDSMLAFTDAGGNPIPFKPGTTYYEVIGIDSNYSNDGGDWYFDFAIP